MNRMSSVLVVVPWYVSLIVFWGRQGLSAFDVIKGLIAPESIVLSVCMLVIAPVIAIYLHSKVARRKLHNQQKYLMITSIIAVVVGILGSSVWEYNMIHNNTLILLAGLVLLLVWKLIWDYPVRRSGI